MRWEFAIALGLAVAAAGRAQTAQQILEKTAETYRNLQSCHFAAVTVSTTHVGSTESKSQIEMDVAYQKPDKMRVEYKYPNGGEWVRATDGQNAFQYRAWTKQFSKAAVGPADLHMLNGTPMIEYQSIDAAAARARLVRQETLDAGGKRVDCYVIEVADEAGVPTTYWIDKTAYLVMQEQIGAENAANTKLITFTIAEVNQPVPEELFTVAPPGAK